MSQGDDEQQPDEAHAPRSAARFMRGKRLIALSSARCTVRTAPLWKARRRPSLTVGEPEHLLVGEGLCLRLWRHNLTEPLEQTGRARCVKRLGKTRCLGTGLGDYSQRCA